MSTSALAADERVTDVEVTEDELTVRLMDGRAISVPLVWYPRLLNATPEQRKNWRTSGGGYGIHWEDIDEDLSSAGLLRGIPASRQSASAMHAVQPNKAKPYEHSSVGSTSSSTQEDGDASRKGILDYFVEGEEAANELLTLVLTIGEQIDDISSKVEKRMGSINDTNDTVPGIKPSDIKTILLSVAADITAFSKGIEEIASRFERNTHILEESLSIYITLVQPEDNENIERLRALKESLSASLEKIPLVKESISVFKDAAQAIRDKDLIFALTKATARQSNALAGLIASIDEFESFALRIMFKVDEKPGTA